MSNPKRYKTADEILADMPEGEREALKLLVAEIIDTERTWDAWRSLAEAVESGPPVRGVTVEDMAAAAALLGIDTAAVTDWYGMTAIEMASEIRFYEQRKKFRQSLE